MRTQCTGFENCCGRAGLADLQHELAVAGELQDVAVLIAVRREPDEALVVDVDAVLVLRPVVALARAAPGLDEIALGIELEHRGGGLAALRARRVEGRRPSRRRSASSAAARPRRGPARRRRRPLPGP